MSMTSVSIKEHQCRFSLAIAFVASNVCSWDGEVVIIHSESYELSRKKLLYESCKVNMGSRPKPAPGAAILIEFR